MRDADWRWVLNVNLEGVANGLQAFLPRMKAQPGEKHVVNTASVAGSFAMPGIGIYNATKYAVVAISETLAPRGRGLGTRRLRPVSRRGEHADLRERAQPSGGARRVEAASRFCRPTAARACITAALDPLAVGRRVRAAVQNDELYVFTHPDSRALFERRAAAIRAGFDAADRWRDE